MRIEVEISPGELLDKISILELKVELLSDSTKLANVRRELAALSTVRQRQIPAAARLDELVRELASINRKLWRVEDALRDCEQRKHFGEEFVELARSVYLANDARCAIKRAIDEFLGSNIVEEKSYTDYA